MIGRHIIGAIELRRAMRSTSPRSSHLNFLFDGYFLHSRSASCSPGSGGVVAVAPDGVPGVGGGGTLMPPGVPAVPELPAVPVRVPVGGGTLRPCASATAGTSEIKSAMRIGRVIDRFVLIESRK